MVTYSTNMMGPVNLDWYRQRNLTKIVTKTVNTQEVADIFGLSVGDSYTTEEVTEYCAAGRIDIRGLDENEYFLGEYEYALAPMNIFDWYDFSEYLESLETEKLWTLDELVEGFQSTYNRRIRWR